MLTLLRISAPLNGKYTFHSLKIGSHTKRVLFSIPLEVLLARFAWGYDSSSMSALYFDRTIRLSANSYWFLCASASRTGAVVIASPPSSPSPVSKAKSHVLSCAPRSTWAFKPPGFRAGFSCREDSVLTSETPHDE